MGSVRPYVYGRLDLLEFVAKTFDAVELERNKIPGGFHVEESVDYQHAIVSDNETGVRAGLVLGSIYCRIHAGPDLLQKERKRGRGLA